MDNQPRVIVKTYSGNENEAMAQFRLDAEYLAKKDYYPTSQTYAPGSYGCAAFIGALLLCLLIIGILIFIYMLIVKPAGKLSVTYEYRPSDLAQLENYEDEKTCPMCAEKVKAEAKICRFCGHKFENTFKKSTSSGVFIPSENGFKELTTIDSGHSFNDIASHLGRHPDTLQGFFHEGPIKCIAFEVFTKNVVFVMTDTKTTTLSKERIDKICKGYDPSIELDNFMAQELLKDAIENQSFSVEFLSRVLELNDNGSNSVLYSDKLGLYLYFSNGFLEDFQSADGLNASAKSLKDLNPKLFERYQKEAAFYWGNDIKKVLKEVNMQIDALYDTSKTISTKYSDLHKTPQGNINYVNLLIAHTNKKVSLSDFLDINHGRYKEIKDSQEPKKFRVNNFMYQSDGELITSVSIIND